MRLVENPIMGCDVMSFISLTQTSAIMMDMSIDMSEKQKLERGLTTVAAVFCGVAVAFHNEKIEVDGIEYTYLLTLSMATIGEPDSRDGAYVYIARNSKAFHEMPKPDSRIEDVICIYASFDIENPFVEFYYGDIKMCTVTIPKEGIPHVTMCDKNILSDEFMSIAYDLINKAATASITNVEMTRLHGYKRGYDAAMNGGE